MKIIIIGGSAGGASVAARLRRLDESTEIVMFEKSASISFAKMDQEQFERLFQDVLQVAINVVGAKEEEILKELINFM